MGLPRFMLNIEGRKFYWLMSTSCALAFLTFGYDAGVLGGVQTTPAFLNALGITGDEQDGLIIPVVASSYILGSFVMAIFLIVSSFGYRFGRRNSILLGDLFVMIGGTIQASSFSIAQICVGRVITGFGIGLISATVSTYMSETTIKHVERGPQVAIQCVWLIWGVALAYWVTFGTSRRENDQFAWRLPIALQALFTLLSGSMMLVLPDTPRWYYSRGRIEDGDRVLSMLYAQSIESEEPARVKQAILNTIKLETEEGKIIWTDWFWDRSPLQSARRIKTSFILLALHQIMGINLFVYYATIILSNVGLDPFMQRIMAGIATTIFATGTLFTVPTIERWGRRPLMLWTAVGCTLSVAVFLAMQGLPTSTRSTQLTAVAFAILFMFLTGWGWMGVPWLYGPEIAPLRYRHQGGAAGILGEWSMCYTVVFGGGIAVQRVGWPVWFWQLGSCVITVIFVYFWCPETAGKTLEEIDEIFMEDAKRWPGPKPRLEHIKSSKDLSDDERESEKSGHEILEEKV